MSKYVKIFIILAAMLLCVGCGKEDNKADENRQSTLNEEKNNTETQNTQTQNSGNYFKDANIIQDYNPNQAFRSTGIIQTVENDLMYSIVGNFDANNKHKTIIYVADLKTGVQVPLCSKVDYNHNNDKCNILHQ